MDLEQPTVPVGITEPVPRGLARLLRRAVLDHTRDEQRRVYPAAVHVGLPGRVTATLELDVEPEARLDHALRVDVLEAMVRRTRQPGPPALVWLTRRGPLEEAQDDDLAWSSAARSAGAELGVLLPMVVVDRQSWRDPRTGVGQSWMRLRESR